MLTHWFFFRDRTDARLDWAPGATVFAVVTVLTIGLFSSTQAYTGPIARALGGTDIGYFVGFFVAGGVYLLVERSFIGRRSVTGAASPPRTSPQPEGLSG